MTSILVVDDDPHIRELVGHFLQQEGLHVIEAVDGLDALRLLADHKVDLVVLDIMMPGMDGWELCRQLRQQTDLPLLMLTAKGETSQIIKGFTLGTDDYLVKPFDPLVLVARVKALLKRYRIMTSQVILLGELVLRGIRLSARKAIRILCCHVRNLNCFSPLRVTLARPLHVIS